MGSYWYLIGLPLTQKFILPFMGPKGIVVIGKIRQLLIVGVKSLRCSNHLYSEILKINIGPL
jgi:hypothetical protein